MTVMLQHPILGEIKGNVKDGVVQYLGIKFATLAHRLADPVPVVDNDGRGIIDATKFGLSDTECLNLNVTVPAGSQGRKLPVFLFIHGGGFAIGSNSWPHLDQARIVQFSAQRNLPVVGVIINYRLGHLGFMTSKVLRAAGVKSNRALLDQRAALQWIQKSIAGFGSDPDNVTILGESAGAISSMIHLSASKPLFKRATCMSGTTLMRKPMTTEEEENSYNGVLDSLEIKGENAQEQVKALLEIPFDKFLGIPRDVGWAWCVDGDFVSETLTHAHLAELSGKTEEAISAIPAAGSVKDLMLGDCQLDTSTVAMFLAPRKSGIGRTFSEFMNEFSAQPAAVESVLNAYGITPTISDDKAFLHVLQLGTDIAFLAPVLSYANAWPGNTYVYHFNEPNPWEGPWKGQTGHVLDVSLLFMNFADTLTPEQKTIGHAFADHFLKFFNGIAPWPAYTQHKPVSLIIGGSDQSRGPAYVAETRDPKETGRRQEIYSFAQVSEVRPRPICSVGKYVTLKIVSEVYNRSRLKFSNVAQFHAQHQNRNYESAK
ncbi:hypothetical protein B7463_g12213, partial [Scytalidium lignicola]